MKFNFRRFCYLLITIYTVALTTSCKKKIVDPPAKPEEEVPVFTGPDVYVSGNIYTAQFSTTAVYWKNGVMKKLTADGINSTTTAIFVKGKDIYISGGVRDNNVDKAVYWKNGTMITLGDGYANDIVVQGDDVYVAGSEEPEIKKDHLTFLATYWKNGVPVTLTNPIAEFCCGIPTSTATAIAIENNNIHIAGHGSSSYGGNNYAAFYWKNSVAKTLTYYSSTFGNFSAKSNAYDIAIENGIAYIAGGIIPATDLLYSADDIGGAVYWKNTEGIPLIKKSTYGNTLCIAVKNGKVYAGAQNTDGTAMFLNNDVITTLQSKVTPSAVQLYNDDIYMAAYFYRGVSASEYTPLYYKNGKAVALLSPPYSGTTTGIAVIAH